MTKLNTNKNKNTKPSHINYKTIITFVSLSNDILTSTTVAPIIQPHINIEDNQMGTHFSFNKKQYVCFFDDQLTSHEQIFACRSSDIIVFLLNSNFTAVDKLRYLKKYLPSFLVAIIDKKDLKIAKKVVKHEFGDAKIVLLANLMNTLMHVKIKNTSLCDRPYIIPYYLFRVDNDVFVRGYVQKRFLTKKLICNGFLRCEILESSLPFEDDIEYEFQENENEAINESEEDNENDENTVDDHAFESDDESEEIFRSASKENLISKYKDYKGIRDLKTCDFNTDSYPSYYQNLTFIKNFDSLKNRIKKRKQKGGFVELKLRFIGDIKLPNFIVLFNEYSYEDIETIVNFDFTADPQLEANKSYILDCGHLIVAKRFLLSDTAQGKVLTTKDELACGTASFIGNYMIDMNKIIFNEQTSMIGNNLILDYGNYIGQGFNTTFCDRVFVDEKVLVGYPLKIDKGYCTVKRMFSTKDEVMYFLNLGLYTKTGKKGIVKKPIGTHGIFKAWFDKPVNHGEKVCMSLYKRAFPPYNG